MNILSFLSSENGLALITAAAAYLSHRFVKKRRDSKQSEVDRWAKNAARGVVMAAKLAGEHGSAVGSTKEIINQGVAAFRTYAATAGVDVLPDHETRALALIAEEVNHAGQVAGDKALAQLRAAAIELEARLRNAGPR